MNQRFISKVAVLSVLALALVPCARALELSKEIGRMPADQRPSPAQIAAAEANAKEQHEYVEALRQRLEPQLQEWAKKGKPYIPRAIYPTDLPQADVPAFPGAEGAGSFTYGGRGGKTFVVTSLEDSGPGTFREACEAAGPRIVVFNVAGIIHLKRPIDIIAPYITIAGQTAPGDGVCIAGMTTHIETHDVVIRYMRFRRGATDLFDRDDCLGGQPIGNVIIDHCSTSWGLDENLSLYRHVYTPKDSKEYLKYPTLNLTIQWSISSESLNKYNHAFGGTWGGFNTSFHHNLFACNTGRNPSIGMSYDFNFVNNVIFNWRHRSLDGGDQGSRVNCINNYYKPGPVTEANVRHRIGLPQSSTFKPDPTIRLGKWYVSGNIVEGDQAVTADNWNGGVQFSDGHVDENTKAIAADHVKDKIAAVRVNEPFPQVQVTTQSAAEAYQAVLAGSGATLPARDSVDTRATEQARTGKVVYTEGKGIISDVSQIGGYPEYKGQPASDVGSDGIPAWWKTKYKLDAKDADLAAKDLQGDGYTVMEKYLAGLDPTKKIDWSKSQSNVNTLTAASFHP